MCGGGSVIDECGECGGNGVAEACDCEDTSGLNADGCCDDVEIDDCDVCGGTGTDMYYYDIDGDGEGDTDEWELACGQPIGYVTNDNDGSPEDGNACHDFDGDGCDDCSSGSSDVANDGDDSDGDGLCDVGDICDFDVENDADGDGVCESDEIAGCQDASSCNYNSAATDSDDSCIYVDGICETCSGETDGTGNIVDNDSDDDTV